MVLRRVVAAACGLLLVSAFAQSAAAEVMISVDKSTQQMTVSVDGAVRHVWPVSTGRSGFGTPNGSFRAQWMARRWFSRKYDNSPMPHSIFFHEGFAIHGTNYVARLGGPASHGCVRLSPANAATLYALVKEQGTGNTRVAIAGTIPVQAVRKRRGTQADGGARRHMSERSAVRASSYALSGGDSYYPAYPGSRPYRVSPYARW